MTDERQDEETLHEVIVLGGGLAGCCAAYELARCNVAVLVLEQHARTAVTPPPGSLLARLRGKLFPDLTVDRGGDRWFGDLSVWLDEPSPRRRPLRLPAALGRGPGGSSVIYGAALGRMRREDFERDDSSPHGDGALPNAWPFGYDTLKPWYRQAEALLDVCGTPDPLDPDDDSALRAPPPLSPQDGALVRDLHANGKHPFRLHVAIQYRPGCAECLGVRCARECKSDGENRALRPALATGRARLETGFLAREVRRVPDGTLEVVSWPDASGQVRRRRARRVILTAGALNTPLVLQRSAGLWTDGAPPPMLGRGAMFHGGDLFAVFGRDRAPAYGPAKTLSFRDFYRVDDEPLGELQSVGLRAEAGMIAGWIKQEAQGIGLGGLGPWLELARIPAAIGARLFRDAALFGTQLEDFPYDDNRVFEDPESGERPGGISVVYRTRGELLARIRRMRRLAAEAFRPNRVFFLTRVGQPNWGHPLGTCRMGDAPELSVVDAEGQVHGAAGVYVADGSIFPSSGGVNPSLTIAANALRIAAAIARSVDGETPVNRAVGAAA